MEIQPISKCPLSIRKGLCNQELSHCTAGILVHFLTVECVDKTKFHNSLAMPKGSHNQLQTVRPLSKDINFDPIGIADESPEALDLDHSRPISKEWWTPGQR